MRMRTSVWVVSVMTIAVIASRRTVAGAPVVEWGKVPMEHLSMQTFPQDSNAAAVVLFDLGTVRFNQDYDLVYHHYRRIKILKSAGFIWGTHEFSYYAEEGTQDVDELEGSTITLQPDGSVKTQELDDDAIFDEASGEGWHHVKFTLPSLTEGCVIEYRYTMVSKSPLYMPDWEFQLSEPVLWSEFNSKIPLTFTYGGAIQGYQRFLLNTSEDVRESFQTVGGIQMVPMRNSRMVLQNAPALRDEPFVTTLDDYRMKVSFQLQSVQWPGSKRRTFLDTWEKLRDEFLGHKRLGGQLGGFGAVRDEARSLTQGITDTLKRLEALYDFVRNSIVWNERYSPFVQKDIDDVLREKTGNCGEVNLLLTAMLREAGIRADPIMLSTRGHGKIQTWYPLSDQFNYLICRATVGGTAHFLDATDRFQPRGLLPRRALNHKGLLVDKGPVIWLDIVPAAPARTNVEGALAIRPDGHLAGTIEIRMDHYAGADERRSLASGKEEEYVKNRLRSELFGLTIDSSGILNRDNIAQPLILRTSISSDTYCQVLDDFIYVNPNIVDRLMENPLKATDRSFPMDFATGDDQLYSLSLTAPEGYQIREFPRDVTQYLPMSGGTYTRQTSVSENTIHMTVRYKRTHTLFEPRFYQGVRNFFQQVAADEAEQIVLQKAPPPPPQATPKDGAKRKKGH